MKELGDHPPLGKLIQWELGKKVYTQQQWYTPAEVAVHNNSNDCWVALNDKVFNLTPWLEQQLKLCQCTKTCSCPVKNWYCAEDCVEYCNCFKRGYLYCDAKRLAMTIIAYAGKDLSHWFKGDEWLEYIHPITWTKARFMRHGSSIHQPVVPSTRWRPLSPSSPDSPWWLNQRLILGNLTKKKRPIRITNTLTAQTVTLEVCSEETIYQIMMRYMPHNRHYHSYTFRHLGKGLCFNKTLEENGIPDEREIFEEVALPDNVYIPVLLLYFNDDFTEDYVCPIHDAAAAGLPTVAPIAKEGIPIGSIKCREIDTSAMGMCNTAQDKFPNSQRRDLGDIDGDGTKCKSLRFHEQ